MSEAKTEAPPLDLPADLRSLRDEFVQTFFRRGVELSERLMQEHDRLMQRLRELERENADFRTQLASGTAIRDLLDKIAQLEADKQQLLGHRAAAEAQSLDTEKRYGAIEEELSTLANVYVAGQQLGSTLDVPAILRHMRELLNQLVGARSFGLYLTDAKRERLVYVTGESVPERFGRPISFADAPNDPAVAVLERAVLAGVSVVGEDPHDGRFPMAACVPMRFGDTVVGVIAIYSVLPQKAAFMPVDLELFRLLSTQGAVVLYAAQLFADAGQRLPAPEAIVGRSGQRKS